MSGIQGCIKTLEKLSLLTCSKDVQVLLERTLKNVQPILDVNTEGVSPLLWQNKLPSNRMHKDQVNVTLTSKDIRKNAAGFYEDYIAISKPKDG